MKIGIAREQGASDRRIPLMPTGAKKLVDLGAEVLVESGLGESLKIPDSVFEEQGAEVKKDRKEVLGSADMVLRLRKPSEKDLESIREGSILVSLLDPFNNRKLLDKLARRKLTSLCMELIPRTTIAQKMDALSSQANLAGYAAVIVAADALPKSLPMMTTPSGTLAPARVFIIGAGVAGLQAIATAKRLGAIVEAFDTRPAVEEQVRSLGGRFVKVDLGETGETREGYARQLTEEQLAKQREVMAQHCEKSDIVITTAQVFGKRAPLIVTEEMVGRMKPGSILVDLAVDTGGNVAGSKPGEVVEIGGVSIYGYTPLQAQIPVDASEMYSNNLVALVSHFWDADAGEFQLKMEDEIIESCLVTHEGEICHELFQKEKA